MTVAHHSGGIRRRSLMTRLIIINMLGLLGFLAGVILLGQTRAGLTEAYRQSLEVQAVIMARALGGLSVTDMPSTDIPPDISSSDISSSDIPSDMLSESARQANNLTSLPDDAQTSNTQADNIQIDNPQAIAGAVLVPSLPVDEAALLLRRIILPTGNRARFYNREGKLLLDTRKLTAPVQIEELDSSLDRSLSHEDGDRRRITPLRHWLSNLNGRRLRWWQADETRPILTEISAQQGRHLAEVQAALAGTATSLQRRDDAGRDILTMAVPVQYYRAIIGVLLVNSPPGTIDALVADERVATLRLFLVLLIVTIGLSAALARTITLPVQRLAGAVRDIRAHAHLPDMSLIPDLSQRADEIGDLSLALRDMLARLLARMDTIENFSADIAHELKNPIASLHSALQSLQSTDNADERRHLQAILLADIERLNRLITDISAASQLDASLERVIAAPFDFAALVTQIVPAQIEAASGGHKLEIIYPQTGAGGLTVYGHAERTGQILTNITANALSFSPPGAALTIGFRMEKENIIMQMLDSGVGIPENMQERIFERFYTDRPDPPATSYRGQTPPVHSGLGLSISRRIAEAQGGSLSAAHAPDARLLAAHKGVPGACFTLFLPRADKTQSP